MSELQNVDINKQCIIKQIVLYSFFFFFFFFWLSLSKIMIELICTCSKVVKLRK